MEHARILITERWSIPAGYWAEGFSTLVPSYVVLHIIAIAMTLSTPQAWKSIKMFLTDFLKICQRIKLVWTWSGQPDGALWLYIWNECNVLMFTKLQTNSTCCIECTEHSQDCMHRIECHSVSGKERAPALPSCIKEVGWNNKWVTGKIAYTETNEGCYITAQHN